MIISLDVEKDFENIHHALMIKVLERAGIQGTYLNIMKAIYSKPITNITKWRKTQSNSTEIRNKSRLSTILIFIQ